MPVILPEAAEDRWLDPGEGSREKLLSLLKPYPPSEMAAYEVTPIVNSAGHDAPDCIAPAQS
jgi:putative SOS response-associated peptidase YedK